MMMMCVCDCVCAEEEGEGESDKGRERGHRRERAHEIGRLFMAEVPPPALKHSVEVDLTKNQHAFYPTVCDVSCCHCAGIVVTLAIDVCVCV